MELNCQLFISAWLAITKPFSLVVNERIDLDASWRSWGLLLSLTFPNKGVRYHARKKN